MDAEGRRSSLISKLYDNSVPAGSRELEIDIDAQDGTLITTWS
jgi:hypothetical protein